MSGKKREQTDRECGLTFSWRTPETSGARTCAAVVVVSLLSIGILGAIRVRIMPLPRIIERHASVLMIPNGPEGALWSVSVDEQGPFPARYEVGRDPVILGHEKAVLAQTRKWTPSRPALRDLPVESGPPAVPVSLRGERFFPEEQAPMAQLATSPLNPLVPTLRSLSQVPLEAWPSEFPDCDDEIPAAVAAKPWRFMVEIGPAGRVLHQQPLERADDEATAAAIQSLARWIGRVKFGPSAKPGWIGVEVVFTRGQ